MKAIVVLGLLLAIPVLGGAQDPLRVAKDLYASASYEEALATLSGIASSSAEMSRQVDMYRAFCLYALGRTTEAEKVAEALVQRDPLMTIDEAAPRIEAMFMSVRKRLLPTLIRTEYRSARSDLDEKKPESAARHLMEARQMLAEAQKIGAWNEGLADLQVLVDGFLALTRATAEPEKPAEVEAPVRLADAESARRSPGSSPTPGAAGPAGTFGPEDEEVMPPTIVEQRAPRLPEHLRRLLKGSLETGVFDLIIDETGAVQQATVRTSIFPAYDAMVITASRSWKYVPATRNGVRVKYRKSIQITVN